MKNHNFRFLIIMLLFFVSFSAVNDVYGQRRKIKKEEVETPEEVINRKNVITAYPFSFIASSVLVGYERNYAPKKSIKVLGGFTSSENSNYYSSGDFWNGTNRVINLTGFYLEAQPRFYLIEHKRPMNGLYMAPVLLYKQMNFDMKISSGNNSGWPGSGVSEITLEGFQANAFALGYIVGYQALFRSSFTLDFYLGGGMMRARGDYKMLNPIMGIDEYRNSVVIHLGAAFGVAF